MDDITPDILAELVSGEIGDAEAIQLRARIAATPNLAESLADFERLAAFLRDEEAPTVSAAAIRDAKRRLNSSSPGLAEQITEKAARGVRTFIAALDFDSRFSPAHAGYRGVSEVVQVAFSAEPCEIDIEIQPEADGVIALRGQIDSEGHPEPWRLILVDQTGTPSAELRADEDGSFSISLAPGTYTLDLRRGDVRVEAGPLPLP